MQQQMTKKEAANVIDQALSQVQATRETHIMLQQALSVLVDEPESSATE